MSPATAVPMTAITSTRITADGVAMGAGVRARAKAKFAHMAEVRKVDGVDGVLLQMTLTGAEVTSLDRGDVVEFSDPNVGRAAATGYRSSCRTPRRDLADRVRDSHVARVADPGRRFDDLFDLVCDPGTLAVALGPGRA